MDEEPKIYKLSAHKINMALECAKKFYMYLNSYPKGETDTKYIDMGNAVHNYLEDRFKSIEKDPEEYFKSEGVLEERREVFNTCIENANKKIEEIKVGVPEKTVIKKFTTPKGRQVELTARIDLITDNEIIDWKTGSSVDKGEYRVQGHIYLFALDFTKDQARFVGLQNGKDMVVLPPKNKDYIPKLCDTIIDIIETENWKKHESFNCEKFCDYYRICKGDLQYIYIEDIKNDPEKYGLVSGGWKR